VIPFRNGLAINLNLPRRCGERQVVQLLRSNGAMDPKSPAPKRSRAFEWEKEIAGEKPEQTARLLEEAEPFVAHRPPRQPVSLRLDPSDLSLAKRIARGKGIPFTQLMAMWLHERISREKSNA
jgi:predicted DNA binding CopG/RHH family protein